MEGFEVVKGRRGSIQSVEPQNVNAEVVQQKYSQGSEHLMNAVADNFDTILNLASDIVSIQKMKVQSDITIAHMREAREQLLAESQAYVQKKDADTRSIVERMEVIRSMMNDFYQHSSQLTSEDFCKIITEVVNQMGKMENGG